MAVVCYNKIDRCGVEMNIIIMGKSRSGKSMLANMICSQIAGYSKISLDPIVMAFKKAFAELEFEYYKEKENGFTEFIETYLGNCFHQDLHTGISYVFEGASLPKEMILRLKDKPNTKVIFLGKTKLTSQQFFDEIRHYEKALSSGGWTKRLDDETLMSWCTDWIKKSKQYQEFCQENGIDFIDTSFNQIEVLQEIVKKIKSGEWQE